MSDDNFTEESNESDDNFTEESNESDNNFTEESNESDDNFTEVSNESWLSRIGGAIKGIVLGFIFLIVAFPLLFWNEGRAVKQFKTLQEGSGAVVSVMSDKVDSVNAGKLVHMTGKADTTMILMDPVFGVCANGLKLKRVVDMYQWKETIESNTQKKPGGGTETVKTFKYTKEWMDKAIKSAEFKQSVNHKNPGSLPYESTEQIADMVTIGAFALPAFFVREISNFEALPVNSDTPLPTLLTSKASVHDAGFYLGADPATPQVGDIRIMFKFAKPSEVSVIAKQVENTLEPYHTKAGGEIALLQMGIVAADTMIQRAQENNEVLTWIFRFVGFLLMLFGLYMMFNLLSVLADVLPILGDILASGIWIISFFIAAILSLITIAIAWIFFRPILGIILFVVVVGLLVVFKRKLNSAKGVRRIQTTVKRALE
ncbi:MAG: hypothetical protein CK551_00255 [Planctomycetaceae bacterium]|nr:hypothetical protein [Gemmataceae bacterium]PHX64573.1 MAG: hypothetical protein CK551_00255 [Planctomycetaceae bacterium]